MVTLLKVTTQLQRHNKERECVRETLVLWGHGLCWKLTRYQSHCFSKKRLVDVPHTNTHTRTQRGERERERERENTYLRWREEVKMGKGEGFYLLKILVTGLPIDATDLCCVWYCVSVGAQLSLDFTAVQFFELLKNQPCAHHVYHLVFHAFHLLHNVFSFIKIIFIFIISYVYQIINFSILLLFLYNIYSSLWIKVGSFEIFLVKTYFL